MTGFFHCFSTLGCPELSVKQAVNLARLHKVSAIELRVVSGSLDVPQALADEFGTPSALRDYLVGQDVRIVGIGTSIKLFGGDYNPANFEPFLPWADAIGVPFLRIFDGGTQLADADYDRAGDRLAAWNAERHRRGIGVDLMIETHDSLAQADQLAHFVKRLPDAPILWDAHHTWAKGGADPIETWQQIAPSVVHLHVKDSVARADGRQYVLPGQGDFPMAPLLEQLRKDTRGMPLSLEWERYWHKELHMLDAALVAARGWW